MLRRPIEFTQYTSIAFGKRCKKAGVRPSMGSVGDCFDNAMCESFFATLECELLDRRSFHTRGEAHQAIFVFLESWYNRRRRHQEIGYLSPVEFEALNELDVERAERFRRTRVLETSEASSSPQTTALS